MNKGQVTAFIAGIALSAPVLSETLDKFWGAEDLEKQLTFRHRVESVRDTAFSHNALASTLRTRIGILKNTDSTGLQYTLQAEGVTDLGSTKYNTLSNGAESHPVVSDPSFIELNQAWLGYQASSVGVIAGRQAVNVLNERFIGTDAFRQNEQTYDGITFNAKISQSISVLAGHIYNVNRVIDPDDPDSDIESSVQFSTLNFAPVSWLNVSPYGYWMDLNDDRSNNTVGMQLTSESKWFGKSFFLLLDWATQSAGASSNLDYTASYFNWRFTTEIGEGALTLGTEVMTANPDGEFQTPLASLHDFNGWADRFNYGAGGLGLQDISVGYKRHFGEGVYAEILYHAYSSAADQLTEQMDYGDEWGWRLLKRFDSPSHLEFGFVKYRAEEGGEGLLSDHVQRLWLGISHKF